MIKISFPDISSFTGVKICQNYSDKSTIHKGEARLEVLTIEKIRNFEEFAKAPVNYQAKTSIIIRCI